MIPSTIPLTIPTQNTLFATCFHEYTNCLSGFDQNFANNILITAKDCFSNKDAKFTFKDDILNSININQQNVIECDIQINYHAIFIVATQSFEKIIEIWEENSKKGRDKENAAILQAMIISTNKFSSKKIWKFLLILQISPTENIINTSTSLDLLNKYHSKENKLFTNATQFYLREQEAFKQAQQAIVMINPNVSQTEKTKEAIKYFKQYINSLPHISENLINKILESATCCLQDNKAQFGFDHLLNFVDHEYLGGIVEDVTTNYYAIFVVAKKSVSEIIEIWKENSKNGLDKENAVILEVLIMLTPTDKLFEFFSAVKIGHNGQMLSPKTMAFKLLLLRFSSPDEPFTNVSKMSYFTRV